MTENDYIAEYIREKYPKLLGMDYTCWKIARSISVAITRVSQTCIETAERLSDAFKKYNEIQLSTADIEKYDFPTDDDMKYLRQQSTIKNEAPEAAVDDDEAAQAAGDQKEKSENECEM